MASTVDRSLINLAPKFGLALAEALNELRWQGYDVVIFESMRSFERQAELYAQGRTTPGAIVTNAKPGRSWHNFGLAVDVVDREKLWNKPHNWWAVVGRVAKRYNIRWGGDFSKPDRPHLQWGSPMRLSPSSRAMEIYESEGLEALWREVGAL